MIKDIVRPEVTNVTLAIVNDSPESEPVWKVYLINNNDHPIENTLVASKGYGLKDGEEQRTSILRHFLDTIPANSAALIEPIHDAVFHLNNEYWVSYYIGRQIYDKKFLFVPDSITLQNLVFIPQLNDRGILHS